MTETSNDVSAAISPIIETAPSDDLCGIKAHPAFAEDEAALSRLALMLAAVLPGVRVRRSRAGEWGQLQIELGKYYAGLAHISRDLANQFLAELPAAPVLALERHASKPFIWLLVLGFPAYQDVEDALKRIPDILAAVANTDFVYGHYMVEMFVPRLGQSPSQDGEAENTFVKTVQSLFDFRR
jgi:hypothetical protein